MCIFMRIFIDVIPQKRYKLTLGKYMLFNSAHIMKRLKSEGWVLASVRGSHHKFIRDGAMLIVPHPKKDLPIGTARAIARQAGWLPLPIQKEEDA
jgi:predicted RNA binding protein YcfA (HicA-like mRNA interferase family)